MLYVNQIISGRTTCVGDVFERFSFPVGGHGNEIENCTHVLARSREVKINTYIEIERSTSFSLISRRVICERCDGAADSLYTIVVISPSPTVVYRIRTTYTYTRKCARDIRVHTHVRCVPFGLDRKLASYTRCARDESFFFVLWLFVYLLFRRRTCANGLTTRDKTQIRSRRKRTYASSYLRTCVVYLYVTL